MAENNTLILLVDDQPANIKTLRSFLKLEGFDVRVALNGERAMDALEEYHADIILLDVMMPVMDGFETCRRLKENDELSDIPVIFMTALDSVEDKVAAFAAGGVDYITKPFQQVEVLARIKTHVAIRRKSQELAEALEKVRTLSGFLPICSFCKAIRDDQGYWQKVEKYIAEHSDAVFSHSLCDKCAHEHYEDFFHNKNILK